jgi:hypothetical protein
MLYELLGLGILICVILSLISKDFHKALKKAFPKLFHKHQYVEYRYDVPSEDYQVIGMSCVKCHKIKKHSAHIEK